MTMSKSNNVNPDHYKVAGRERPGNAALKDPKEPESATEKTRASKWRARQREKSKKLTT
jgi:hypothetical protein